MTLPSLEGQPSTIAPEQMLAQVFVENRAALRHRIAARLDRKLRCRLDPSDIMQETLAEACSRIHEYLANPSVPMLHWLFALAEQNSVTAYRRHVVAQKRSTHREELLDSSGDGRSPYPASDSENPLVQFEKQERMERLRQAICMLSPASQVVVRMRFLEGRKLSEIAEALDLSIDAVAKRAVRSLVKLNEFAGELGLGE